MEYEFCHSGIKGMKWGIRRFQNPDGSLTAAGRIHYGVGKSRSVASNRTDHHRVRQEKRAARIAEKRMKKEADQKKTQDAQELKRFEELRKTPAKRLTESEIKELSTRLQMEKSYKDLLKQTEEPKLFDGKKFVIDVLQSSGKTIITGLITYGVGTAINNAAKAQVIKVGGEWKPPEKKKEKG